MKKMYKKPITETILVQTGELMELGTGSNQKTSSLTPGTEGDAPKRRTEVF